MMTVKQFRRSLLPAAGVAILATFGNQAFAQSSGAREYRIDAAGSEIYWRVYKAGAFARFGHNHVVSVPSPDGRIRLSDDLAESTFELDIPVADLVIDEPELRGRHGEDFSSEPTATDIEGTRGNMLGEAVLNGELYPSIEVTGTALSGRGEGQTITLNIRLLGREVSIPVPIDVEISEDAIVASSEFRLMHEDLGMAPFSVMMGALQVAPEIDFTFKIRAIPSD